MYLNIYNNVVLSLPLRQWGYEANILSSHAHVYCNCDILMSTCDITLELYRRLVSIWYAAKRERSITYLCCGTYATTAYRSDCVIAITLHSLFWSMCINRYNNSSYIAYFVHTTSTKC